MFIDCSVVVVVVVVSVSICIEVIDRTIEQRVRCSCACSVHMVKLAYISICTNDYNVPLTDTQFHKNIVDSSVQSLCASLCILFNLIVKCIQSHSFKPTNE